MASSGLVMEDLMHVSALGAGAAGRHILPACIVACHVQGTSYLLSFTTAMCWPRYGGFEA